MKSFPLRTPLAAMVFAALGACASHDSSQAWRIEPVMRVQHSPEASAAFYRTGRYYDGMRRWSLAADEYRKATIADPGNADAFNAMGVALARLGDYTGAENRMRQALALQPDRADIRSNLGLVLAQAGRPMEAVAQTGTASALEQNHPITRDRSRLLSAPASQPAAAPHAPAAMPEVKSAGVVAAPRRIPVIDAPSPVVALTGSPAMRVINQPSVAWRTAGADLPLPEALPVPARLEITNGNGTPGAASRLQRWLVKQGMATQRLSNRKPYTQASTVIEYQEGHEAQARRLANLLPDQVLLRPGAHLRTDLRVLLGRDWQRLAACLEDIGCPRGVMRVGEAGAKR
jgi:tetratricopeptide (TPR) repeat protein